MFKIGNIDIKSLYLGDSEIQKAFLGLELVYQKEQPILKNYFYIESNEDSNNILLGDDILSTVMVYPRVTSHSTLYFLASLRAALAE